MSFNPWMGIRVHPTCELSGSPETGERERKASLPPNDWVLAAKAQADARATGVSKPNGKLVGWIVDAPHALLQAEGAVCRCQRQNAARPANLAHAPSRSSIRRN